jgi:succinate dehydrogenase / fumarate reductase, cytochrome b subunit
MNITNVFKSSVGKKFIMAITGMALFIFVTLHMLGNLQVFLGPESINRYGAFLQGNVELLWPARIVLLVLVLLHIWSAVKLSAENKAARPVAYANYNPTAASYASRTMLMSGLIILAFIIYHLLHFTVQVPAVNFSNRNFAELHDAQNRHDVFAMLIFGFRSPLVAGFYILAMFLLFLHLSHGVQAMFSSLGWKSGYYAPLIARFAVVASWIIFLGYIIIPISVLLGYGHGYLVEHNYLQEVVK